MLGAMPPSLSAGEGQNSTASQTGVGVQERRETRCPGLQPKSLSSKTGGKSCRLPAHLLPGSRYAHLLPQSLEARHPNRALGGRLASNGLASGHAYIHSYLKKKIGILSILDHIIYAHIELNVTLLIMLQNAAFRE